MYVLACPLSELVVLLLAGERANELELRRLRHELAILRRHLARPPLDLLLLAQPELQVVHAGR